MKYRTALTISLAICSPLTHAQTMGRTTSKAESPYKLQLPSQVDYHLLTTLSVQTRQSTQEQSINPELKAKPHAKEIETAARANNLDPALVHALIHVESRHNANALSSKGAIGLMQVLPETAQRFGIYNPTSTQANLNAGTRYLRSLLDLFDQRLDLALAAYNAGEGAVLRHKNQIPPYRETQLYVPAVLNKYDKWQQARIKENLYLSGTQLDPRAVAQFRMETNLRNEAEVPEFSK